MNTQKSQFNRNLLIIMVVLFILSISGFSYWNWFLEADNFEGWQFLFNIPIISIPFILLYGSIYILLIGWRDHADDGQVSPRLAKVIRWAPRVAAMMIIYFISLFSFDVFGMEGSLLEKIGGFLIHNIPSIVLIVLLVFAWKRPIIGFVAFIAAAVLFAAFFVRSVEMLPNLIFFVIPILLIGLLFYADWKWVSAQLPAQTNAA